MRIQYKAVQSALAIVALTFMGLVGVGTTPAQASADNYVFGNTGGIGNQELILNGGQYVIQATTEGWVNSNGINNGGGGNYIAGTCCSGNGVNYEDYFTFSLAGVTGPISSVSFSFWNPSDGFTGAPLTYSLVGLDKYVSTITTSGLDLYNYMTTKSVIGSTSVDSTANGTDVLINLSPSVIADLKNYEGQNVAVGGYVGVSSVPLPAGLPMFVFALLSVFGAVQFSKQRKFA